MSFRRASRGNADRERGRAGCLVVTACCRGAMGLFVFSSAAEDDSGQFTEPESDCRQIDTLEGVPMCLE